MPVQTCQGALRAPSARIQGIPQKFATGPTVPRGEEWHRGHGVVLLQPPNPLHQSYNSSPLSKYVVTTISVSFDVFSWDSPRPEQPCWIPTLGTKP